MSAEGTKFDGGKAPMALLPGAALASVARVLGHGADKYGAGNWQKGLTHRQTLSAALRHIFAFLDGEDFDDGDDGTHESHLACAACEVLFALSFQLEEGRGELDDRLGRGEVAEPAVDVAKPEPSSNVEDAAEPEPPEFIDTRHGRLTREEPSRDYDVNYLDNDDRLQVHGNRGDA